MGAVGGTRYCYHSAQLAKRSAKSPKEAASFLHRYVYRQAPPWPAHRGANLVISEQPAPSSCSQNWTKLETSPLTLRPISVQQTANVPILSHGLERVVRGGGLHSLSTLRDRPTRDSLSSRERPSKATKFLRTITPPDRIAWHRMPKYIAAKHDTRAHQIAAETTGVRYATSTSSITPTLSAFYHLISNFRDTDLVGGLSLRLSELPATFAKFSRRPVAVDVAPVSSDHPGVYSINAHQATHRGPTVLLELGNSIERMLTMPAEEFTERFVLHEPAETRFEASDDGAQRPTADEEQFYHYSVASSFLMRAQIDCRDSRSGSVFDVKTRAVAPIRYDLENYKDNETYRLHSLRGMFDSYEREFYDMVRSVFIKYALQLRIGRMDGALVAYHNTTELLALEYVRLAEIESYVFGSTEWADIAFNSSVRLLEQILERVEEAMFAEGQEDRVKVLFSTDRSRRRLTVFAQRVKTGEEDKLGPEAFRKLEAEIERTHFDSADRLRPVELWHLDSELHNAGGSGVAIVGTSAKVGEQGGERIEYDEAANKRRRRGTVADNPVYSVDRHDVSCLKEKEFYVWHVDVEPVVRGMLAPKGSIRVAKPSQFELRYRIEQVKELNRFIKATYVTELGRLYMPPKSK